MQSSPLARRAVESTETFRGDLAQLATVMNAAWAARPGTAFSYSAELLGESLEAPRSAITSAIYGDHGLLAFAAGLPRSVRLFGDERRLIICAFLTVAVREQTSGLGILAWAGLLQRAAAQGYELAVNYCVQGGEMDRMIARGCALLGLALAPLGSFASLARPVFDTGAGPPEPASAQAALLRAAAELTGERCELAQQLTDQEARWRVSRPGALLAGADGDAPAALTGRLLTLADAATTRCLAIGDVLWSGLEQDAQLALVNELLIAAAARGATFAFVPELAYADHEPFARAGFRRAAPLTNAYLIELARISLPRSPTSFYLDVV